MKAIKSLEAAKNLITAIKADAKTGDSISSLVKQLHREAKKQGHEEASITEFVKQTMTDIYGDQTALFHVRWNAARNALFHTRKAAGNNPKASKPFKLSRGLTDKFIQFLAENNISDEDMKRAAQALAANIVIK